MCECECECVCVSVSVSVCVCVYVCVYLLFNFHHIWEVMQAQSITRKILISLGADN